MVPPSTFGSTRFCLAVGSRAFGKEINLLKPSDELIDHWSEEFLSFPFVQDAMFVALDSVLVPADQELRRKEIGIVKEFHEGYEELLLAWFSLDEVEYSRLKYSFRSILPIALDKLKKCIFVLGPHLHDVSFTLEKSTEEDVVLILRSDVPDQLNLAHFSEQVLNRRVILSNEFVHLTDDFIYISVIRSKFFSSKSLKV